MEKWRNITTKQIVFARREGDLMFFGTDVESTDSALDYTSFISQYERCDEKKKPTEKPKTSEEGKHENNLGEAPELPPIFFAYDPIKKKLEVRDRRGNVITGFDVMTANGADAYHLWKEGQKPGSDTSFEAFMKAFKGENGHNGDNGKSAYELWRDSQPENTDRSEYAYQKSLRGKDGKNAFELWKEVHGEYENPTIDDFFEYLKGENGYEGHDGKDAYEVWKENQPEGKKSLQDYLNYIAGKQGNNGESAYEMWLRLYPHNGQVTEEDFFRWLAGLAAAQAPTGDTFIPTIDNEGKLYFTNSRTKERTEAAYNVHGKDGKTYRPVVHDNYLWFEDEDGNVLGQKTRIKGDTGETGRPGKSAYEIWRDDPLHPENHDKSEDDYRQSLRGEDGHVVTAHHDYLKELKDWTCPIETINPNMLVSTSSIQGVGSAEETIKSEKNRINNLRHEGEKFVNHGSWIQEFFWWCAGADRPLLRMCPGDHSKYMGIGTVIFFTALMAWFSSFVALGLVTGESKSPKDTYEILIPVISLILISVLCFFGYKFHKLKRKENYLQSELSQERQKQIVDADTIRLELEKSGKTSQIKGLGNKMIFTALSFAFIAFISIILFKDGFDGFKEYIKDYWLIALVLGIEGLVFSRLLINNKKQLEELKQDLYNKELNISEKSSQTSSKVDLDNILNLRREVRQSELDVKLLVIKFFLAVVFTILLGIVVASNFSISWAAFFACAWSLMIFFLDRFITNTMYSDGKVTISWLEFRSALPRIVIAIFLGIVISAPLELQIFKQEVKTQIEINEVSKVNDYFTTKKNVASDSIAKLTNQLKTARANLSRYCDLKHEKDSLAKTKTTTKVEFTPLRQGNNESDPDFQERVRKQQNSINQNAQNAQLLDKNNNQEVVSRINDIDTQLGQLTDIDTLFYVKLLQEQRTAVAMFDSLKSDSVNKTRARIDSLGLFVHLEALHSLAYNDDYSEWNSSISLRNQYNPIYWAIAIAILLSLIILSLLDTKKESETREKLSSRLDQPVQKGLISYAPWIFICAAVGGFCNETLFHALPCYLFSAIGMIMMLFILIDVSPVFYKMMLADGVYDKLLHKEKLIAQDEMRLNAAKTYAQVNSSEIGRLAPFVFGTTSEKIYKILKNFKSKSQEVAVDVNEKPVLGFENDRNKDIDATNKDVFEYVLKLKQRIVCAAYLAWYRDQRDYILGMVEDNNTSGCSVEHNANNNAPQDPNSPGGPGMVDKHFSELGQNFGGVNVSQDRASEVSSSEAEMEEGAETENCQDEKTAKSESEPTPENNESANDVK